MIYIKKEKKRQFLLNKTIVAKLLETGKMLTKNKIPVWRMTLR